MNRLDYVGSSSMFSELSGVDARQRASQARYVTFWRKPTSKYSKRKNQTRTDALLGETEKIVLILGITTERNHTDPVETKDTQMLSRMLKRTGDDVWTKSLPPTTKPLQITTPFHLARGSRRVCP